MPRMTINISDEIIKRFREEHPEINLAEVVRRGIIKKLKVLEELKLKGKI